MTHEELQQKVTTLNAKSSSLNQQRLQNIGRKETLQKQLSSALQQYNEKYGTNLTEEGVDAELSKVASELEAQVADIEAVISSIESGNYADAEKLVKEGSQVAESSMRVTQEAEPNVAETMVEPSVVVEPKVAEPQVEPSTMEVPNVTEPKVAEPTQEGVAPIPSVPPVAPPPMPSGIFSHDFKQSEEENEPSPVAPPSFASIIGGSQFEQ